MTSAAIPHWREGEPAIEIAVSRRGRRAVVDPWAVLIRAPDVPWPPPELVQKCYASRQRVAFAPDDQARLSQRRGYYSDLQSLASEDALTWNAFGPLVYAPPPVRTAYVVDLCRGLGIGLPDGGAAPAMWLWRRLPHPENHAPGGPEVDMGIQSGPMLLLIEAKWLSPLGRKQGVNRDRDQMELRDMFCRGTGQRLYPSVSHFVLMELGRKEDQGQRRTVQVEGRSVTFVKVSWNRVATVATHPLAAELRDHLRWKERYGVSNAPPSVTATDQTEN